MLVDIICSYCDKTFGRPLKQVNQDKSKGRSKFYCSKECESLGKSVYIVTTCYTCNKEISIRPSQLKKSKSGKHYCSQSCAITENNKGTRRNYKHGLRAYRDLALNFYGAKCSICGYDNKQVLEVHHRDHNRKNNEIDNLDVLCPTHHTEYQLGFRKY